MRAVSECSHAPRIIRRQPLRISRELFDVRARAHAKAVLCSCGSQQPRTGSIYASVDELSGGRHPRVLLAMLLALGTPVPVLNEYTTLLDIAHQIELLSDMNQRCARSSKHCMRSTPPAVRLASGGDEGRRHCRLRGPGGIVTVVADDGKYRRIVYVEERCCRNGGSYIPR